MMKFVGVVAAAILLGMVSPFMAAVDEGPMLRAWFQWLPVQVDLVFMPEGDFAMLVVAMVALTAQYLVVFLLADADATADASLAEICQCDVASWHAGSLAESHRGCTAKMQ